MHTKYSEKQVLSSEHDYQVKKFHKGDLSFYKIGRLTVIGRVFKKANNGTTLWKPTLKLDIFQK